MMAGIFILLGLVIGSFINVLIDRAPLEESVLWGRSRCDHCKKPLRWFELIPLFSYIAQLGRCRRCHKKLRLQYPIVEAANGVLFALVVVWLGPITSVPEIMRFIGLLMFASASLGIFVADVRYQLIPDGTIVLLALASIVRFIGAPVLIPSSLGTAVVAFGLFFFLWWITKGKGMGFGDVKLAGVLGLYLGYPDTILAFYVAFLTGAIVGVILMIGKRAGMKTKIAFGPFLIFGAVVSLIFSKQIYGWWYMLI